MFELETCPARINPWISLLKQQLRRFRRQRPRKQRTDRQPFAYAAERLEDRTLLAGPELVAILPNVGNFLTDGEIRNEAPGELTLRFSPGQTIDPATLSGITIVGSGADGIFGNANDVPITPGFRGIGSSANEVVFRFAETLADDQYRITIAGTGANALENTSNEPFHAGVDLNFNFELDLGAQVTAVVPQPVLRNKVLAVANVAQLTDGDRFTVTAGGSPVTFEFDNGGAATGTVLANGNIAVAFTGATPSGTVAAAVQTAINGVAPGLDVTTSLSGSQVTIAGGAFNPTLSTTLTTGTALTVTDGGLTQRQNVVTVFFNNDPLNAAEAVNPAFYRLVDTATNAILLPSSVTYSSTNNTAKLTFAANLPSSTFRLRIGQSGEPNNTIPTVQTLSLTGAPTGGTFTLSFNSQLTTPIAFDATAGIVQTALEGLSNINPGDILVTGGPFTTAPLTIQFQGQYLAQYVSQIVANGASLTGGTTPSISVSSSFATNVGTLFSTTGFNSTAFLGDHQGANDVDLYRFALSNAGTINVTVTPQSGLDTSLRLFDGTGAAVAATVVNNGAGVADTLSFVTAAGTFYLGVSSNGNAGYNPVTGTGAAGGSTTGSYSLSIGTTVLLPASDDNSSFSNASDVGVLGGAGQVIAAAITPQTALLFAPEPGGLDEPGHRDIPAESHLGSVGTTPAPLASITVQDYFFGTVYGTDPAGNTLFNAITENQKQRTREIFELYSHYAGIQFRETQGSGIQVVTGDMRALSPTVPTGPGGVSGLAAFGGPAIMDAAENWGNSEYGGSWMATALHEIGHTLGLGHSYDLPSIQGSGLSGEAVFTGDQDYVHLLRLYAPDSTDVDLYRFDLSQSGQFTAETVAQRQATSSLLDTALVLYRQVTPGVREVVARNDDYFSKDSYLNLRLDAGTYFVGVSSTGNTNYDPRVSDSGYGGTTDGVYTLSLNFAADAVTSLTDADNPLSTNPVSARTALDGNADGLPGGTHDFWFESGNTVFVDKSASAAGANGSITNPYNNLATALTVASSRIVVPTTGGAGLADGQTFTVSDGVNSPTTFEFNSAGGVTAGNVAVPFTGADLSTTIATSIATVVNGVLFTLNSVATATGDRVDMTNVTNLDVRGTPGLLTAVSLVRIVGNGGTDRNLLTPADATPYLIGRDNSGNALADGTNFDVPQGVTVMIDAGAVFKSQGAIVDVGTSSVNIDRSQSALQVLGTPVNNVVFTSFHDDSLGGNSDGVSTGPAAGHWGGLVFRQDSDSTLAGVFLNIVEQADLRYGGGQVSVNSQQQVFNPIHLVHERPTISFNTIRFSADAAISADPNSFEETPDRVGPDFHANRLTNNTINGVFVRVQTQLGSPVDRLDVSARLDDTDVTYVVTENLHVNGNAGGAVTVNEQQRLLVTGGPTGGSLTLTFTDPTGITATTAPIAYNAPAGVGINEVQRVTISGAPTGGFFSLTFGGSTTFLNYNSTAAAVQNSLEFLPTIGFGNVLVTGGPGPNTPYVVTFRGTLAGTNVAQMTASGASLTGGSFPAVTVTTTTQGVGSVQAALEALPNIGVGNVTVTGGSLPNSPLTINFAGQFTGRDVTQLTVDATGLTGGSSPAAGVTTLTPGGLRGRLAGQLVIDPGVVVKLLGSRIELERGASQLIAEGTAEKPIQFTSLNDDQFGAGGTFDTGGNGSTTPAAADWGGLIFNAVSGASLDHTHIAYGGGTVPIEGAFDQFNTIEIHQADVRITNSTLENNASGLASSTRNGRGTNDSGTIFVRGAQPIIVNNILVNNAGSAISINANSQTSDQHPDSGRTTGTIQSFGLFDDNSGPLVRLNQLENNGINGMRIRGEELTTESVWDDTDIVHVLSQNDPTSLITTDGLVIGNNFHTYGGLRLESDTTASLVVKLQGANAGFTANGIPLDINDRIGGTIQVVGAPGYPVVMTSLQDCLVGAGFKPDGQPQTDTLSSGECDPTAPQPVGNSGAVLIDGSDRDAHGSALVGADNVAGTADDVNQTGWLFIEQSVNFAANGARNNAPNDVLVIGASAAGGGGGPFGGGSALGAITSVTTVLGLTQTVVTGAAISTVNFNLYKVIYVPTDRQNVGGGVTDADLALLAARTAEIQTFVNSGGSVVALTEATAANPYSWLQLPQPFQIRTSPLSGSGGGPFGGAGGTSPLRLTPEAIAAGYTLTSAELSNGTPYHNVFVGPPGFNGLLPFVLDDGLDQISGNSDDEVVALGLQSGSFGLGVRNPGTAGDWRSVRLDQYSNDRNVAVYNERESSYTAGQDVNATPSKAELLGVLAPNEKSGDDLRRLGFEVHGFVAADDVTDVDVYSFTGTAGSEVWVDLDRTSSALDTMVELIDFNGTVLARSLDNFTRTGSVSTPVFDMTKDVDQGGDYYSTNPKDAGLRLVLPGTAGQNGLYFLRVRSQPVPGNENSLEGGTTTGRYQMQVRLRQRDEKPGSVVTFADLRYATNGVEVLGQPAHSPLAGETAETTGDNAGTAGAQNIGNLLSQDRNTISVAGNLSAADDLDFYRFTVDYQLIQEIGGLSAAAKTWATVFDIDYADGLARPDTTLAIYDEAGRLVMIARDSNVADDQPAPGQGIDLDDLSRGSAGKLDPFIGSAQLAESTAADDFYYVVVSSNRQLPSQLDQLFNAAATVATARLEPVTSLTRVVEDHIGFSGYTSNSAVLGGPVLPTTPELFDITTAIALDTHVRPFNLSDVTLFVNSNGSLSAVNPFNGTFEYTAGNGGTFANMQDIAMRSDGQLWGYRSVPGTANVAGEVGTINTGSGAYAALGTDAIPDTVLNTNQVDALAWLRTGFQGGTPTYQLWYSVRGGAAGSTLFRADPANGSAAVVAGQPWGAYGQIAGPGVVGTTNGMAFSQLTTELYGVSSGGQFYTIDPFGFLNSATLIADLSTTGTGLLNAGEGFTGLALGPQNLSGGPNNTPGFYANLFFGLTTNGRLVALDAAGVPQVVFDSDNDGLADSTTITTNTFGNGLAFSPLDINLWHPTIARATDVGHGINTPFDNSRTPNLETLSQNGRTLSEAAGLASFYFGLEELNTTNNPPTYFTYGVNGQHGVQNSNWQRDLTINTGSNVIGSTTAGEAGNYNLPGGAYGSLLTNAFSLEGYDRNDKPTLYFNYFLETQGANFKDSRMRDAARVFVSSDGGSTWELLATNNGNGTGLFTTDAVRSAPGTEDGELPAFNSVSTDADIRFSNQQVQELFDNTGAWRQARVDLANYAGDASLMLRFDFSTAGEINARPGENALPVGSNFGNSNDTGRAQNNDFEGFYIDDILVGFAERGEMVTGSAANQTTYFQTPTNINPTPPQEQLAGPYQLEIRRGTEYAIQPDPGQRFIVIPQGALVDTNDRLVDAITITAPVGAVIIDGQQFSVSDGTSTRTFEFDSDGSVVAGAVTVPFTANDTAATVAQNMLNSILGVAGFGVNGEVVATSNKVQLIGAVDVTPITVLSNINISLNLTSIPEDGSQTATGTITRDVVTNSPLTVTLTTLVNGSDVVLTTFSVIIPANQASANFFLFGNEDAISEGTETVVIEASATGFAPVTTTIDVIDNDSPALTVTIAPGSVLETSPFGTAVATITRNTTTSVPLTVTLTSLDPSELLVPTVLPGAPINEVEANNSLATAQNLDNAGWSTTFDANIGDATVNTSTTIPHVTIIGTGNGTFDYYSFTVANVGDRGIFDIDATNAGLGDSEIFLYDALGNLLAQDDDSSITEGAGGSTTGNDSFLEFTFLAAGTYIIGVGEFNSTGFFGGIVGNTLDNGDAYQLQVSIQNHPLTLVAAGAATTTVTIPAGSVSVNVPLITVQDLLLDLDQTASIVAYTSGFSSGTGSVTVLDTGNATLTVNVVANSVVESAGPAATTGTVTINLASSADLTINLSSNDTSEATVPASVVILAGQLTSAPFNVDAVDDIFIDGAQTVTVTAYVSGVASGQDTLQVTDDGTDTVAPGTVLWTAQGPSPIQNGQTENVTPNNEVGGALHAVVAHPTNADILYVGSVNGGIW
ncbi:MAG: pre-peptidase C-terminal domain-containing protein, partial [Planctomycetales bacterium]|nr:pre-peptidase C-terminal domain-containing protein [Planctomycetales bacterium]